MVGNDADPGEITSYEVRSLSGSLDSAASWLLILGLQEKRFGLARIPFALRRQLLEQHARARAQSAAPTGWRPTNPAPPDTPASS